MRTRSSVIVTLASGSSRIDLIGFDGDRPYTLREGEITNVAHCTLFAD